MTDLFNSMWYVTVEDDDGDNIRVRRYVSPFSLQETAIITILESLDPPPEMVKRSATAKPVIW